MLPVGRAAIGRSRPRTATRPVVSCARIGWEVKMPGIFNRQILMGTSYTAIDGDMRRWIEKQQMFFVGTAPLAPSGSVNISPKGLDTLRVLDGQTLAFLDYGGSGVETIAHVRENGRIVIMMCAFDGPPKIFRFHGHGEIVTPLDDDFDSLAKQFPQDQPGIRSIIRVLVSRISDSCGFGVPFYDYKGQRPSIPNFIRNKGIEPIRDYLAEANVKSIDGLPGLTVREARSYAAPTELIEAGKEADIE